MCDCDLVTCNVCVHGSFKNNRFDCTFNGRVPLSVALQRSLCKLFEYSAEKAEEWEKTNKDLRHCDKCHNIITEEDNTYFVEDDILCNKCHYLYAVQCMNCGNHIYTRNARYDSNNDYLCNECYEEYHRCYDCGVFVHINVAEYDDDSDPYCENCASRHRTYIHDYNYKPSPIFHEESEICNGCNEFFGIELEVDNGGEDEENADRLQSVGNINNENIYIKHDGSLRNGFEIVSHPCTYEYHIKNLPWYDILTKAEELEYISHNSGTCGLHIHISRKAFGNTESEQELNIMKLLFLFEKYWDKFVKFSRRTESQLEEWARRYYLKNNETPQELFRKALDINNGERYHAINLQNCNTIEIRMFRGTLKYETFIATLQLCKVLIDTVNKYKIEDIQSLSWVKFVTECSEYPELISYLDKRNINEAENNICPYCNRIDYKCAC